MRPNTQALAHPRVRGALARAAMVSFVLTAMPAVAAAAAEAAALEQGPELTATIRELDTRVFDAFNRCSDPAELDRHASFFAPDLEFYHDNGGVTWTREAMIRNTEKNACGNYTRELIAPTFDVSRIAGYGAVSRGTHRFCPVGGGRCEGEAEFLMLWRLEGGQWQVTRAFSFNHRAAE